MDRNSPILLEELKIIANAITDLDHKSTQIKQWCITLITSAWGLGLFNTGVPFWYFLFLPLLPIVFLLIDLSIKRNQRKFLWRARELNYWLNVDSSMSPKELPPYVGDRYIEYDPAGSNTRASMKNSSNTKYYGLYDSWISYKTILSASTTTTSFYYPVAGVSLMLSIGYSWWFFR